MQLLYLDSLEVDEMISDYTPRSNAWDSELISKILKKDRLSPGVFGKLQVSILVILANWSDVLFYVLLYDHLHFSFVFCLHNS